jgi:hypothetical protein
VQTGAASAVRGGLLHQVTFVSLLHKVYFFMHLFPTDLFYLLFCLSFYSYQIICFFLIYFIAIFCHYYYWLLFLLLLWLFSIIIVIIIIINIIIIIIVINTDDYDYCCYYVFSHSLGPKCCTRDPYLRTYSFRVRTHGRTPKGSYFYLARDVLWQVDIVLLQEGSVAAYFKIVVQTTRAAGILFIIS